MESGTRPEQTMQVDAFNLIGRKEVELQGLRDHIGVLEATIAAVKEENTRLRDELAVKQSVPEEAGNGDAKG